MSAKPQIELSKNEVDVLLGLYSGCECLWNSQASDYKEKPARIAAFRSIINGMRLETGKELTIDQAAAKIKSILQVYEQELRKVLQSQQEQTGSEVFQSQWRWFNFLDSFLHGRFSKKIEKPDSVSNDDLDQFLCSSESNTGAQNVSVKAEHDSDSSFPAGSIAGVLEGIAKGILNAGSAAKGQQSVSPRLREKRPVRIVSAPTPVEDPNAGGAAAMRRSSRKRQYTNRYTPPAPLLPRAASIHPRTTPIPILPAPPTVFTPIFSQTTIPVTSRNPTPPTTAAPATTSTNTISDTVATSIANTLFAIQTLMANSLSAQDHPSFVFARHISNELDSIPDYKKRKQCMLEIQQLILRYQTSDKQTVKRENMEVDSNEEDADEAEEDVKASAPGQSNDRQHTVYTDSFSERDDHPPVHFQVPENSKENGGVD